MRATLLSDGISWLAPIVLAVMVSTANAEIYKSIDAAGHTVFSATRPPGITSTLVKPKTSKASGEAIQKLKATSAPAKPDAEAQTDKKKSDTPPEPTAAEKKANCQKSRGILTQLQNSTRLQDYDEKKQLRFLTEAERQQRIKASEASIKSWCKK